MTQASPARPQIRRAEEQGWGLATGVRGLGHISMLVLGIVIGMAF